MEDRKQRVLQAIIDDYISTAEPVGSRTIARKYGLGVSPATIRNEMADLEELGYLEQPHTSAGRIPSDKGYRYYVDHLMTPPPPGWEGELLRELVARAREIDDLLEQAARVLSEATACLSLVISPSLTDSRLRTVQVLPFREGEGILLIATEDGLIRNRIVEFRRTPRREELDQINHLLTAELAGRTIEEIRGVTLRALREELGRYRELLELVFDALTPRDDDEEGERLVLGGTAGLLRQPEFRDVERVHAFLDAIEETSRLRHLLEFPGEGAVAGPMGREVPLWVSIGDEIPSAPWRDCSLVAATYYVGGRPVGRLGILGPRRLDYGLATAVVRRVAVTLSDLLREA